MRVWTKQHFSVLETLRHEGRYVCQREYISKDLDDYAYFIVEIYDWLARNIPNAQAKPSDAKYPVWATLSEDNTIILSEGFVILELEIDEDLITYININKWTNIMNYSYIPLDEADKKSHLNLLNDYNISDCKAYMSNFYPHIKSKIINSWPRLFENSNKQTSCYYATFWQIKKNGL